MDSPYKYYHKDTKSFLKRVMLNNSSSQFINSYNVKGGLDYYILDNSLSFTKDVQKLAKNIFEKSNGQTRIVVISFNFLWKPLLNLATRFGLRKPDISEPNWLTKDDIRNMFYLEGLEEIKNGNRFLFPFDLGIISSFINIVIGHLPLVNDLCLTSYQIFRKIPKKRDYSVSVIIPARNEAGNIKGVLKKIPKLGKKVEVVFVEGGSADQTEEAIKMEIANTKPKWLTATFYKQRSKGKKDAVKIGFSHAKNDILMILDADLTVGPIELKKFYSALANGQAEFANGCRLVYPQEKDAMRTLNYLGNKIFGLLFTFLLGQKIKDTLCGTKALFRKDYLKIKKANLLPGDLDPFGDFDLIFGATHQNLKIIDIPVRYMERKYGSTNISRFKNGFELIKMTLLAATKIKFI